MSLFTKKVEHPFKVIVHPKMKILSFTHLYDMYCMLFLFSKSFLHIQYNYRIFKLGI